MTNRRITSVNRKHADGIAALLISVILLIGGLATWQAYRQWAALNEMGGHMGMDTAAVHGTNPVWYLLGTIVAASIVGGVYIGVRDRISSSSSATDGHTPSVEKPNRTRPTDDPANDRVGNSEGGPDRQVLDLLPDDERRILEPVIESPGLTQIELRDRSDFSKSKVSQTVTALEKRGLLYREPQGRTYRVYPSEEFERNQ